MHDTPGLVAILAYDGLCTFEFGIAIELFALPRPEFDFAWYRHCVVAVDAGPMHALGGFTVTADADHEALLEAQTIIVPGWRNRAERPPQVLLDALCSAHARGARLLSICSGAFVLAAAGLLDGKRATTHWRYCEELAARFPAIAVDPAVLYVDDGQVITSAGSAAGIDACLHLVERDFGAQVANSVACRLVMAPLRAGGQAQFIPAPVARTPRQDLAAPAGLGTRAPARATDLGSTGGQGLDERAHVAAPLQRSDRHDAQALAAARPPGAGPRAARGQQAQPGAHRRALRIRFGRKLQGGVS